jgi:hypothetical protein
MADERPTVIPTNHDTCLLFCRRENGVPVALLHRDDGCVTYYTQIAFASTAFDASPEYVFACDLLDARDGGSSFLQIYDLVSPLDARQRTSFAARRAFIEELFREENREKKFCDLHSLNNEYRLVIPRLFFVDEPSAISALFDIVLPNYYGLARGLRFMDNEPRVLPRYEDATWTVQWTGLPDVYRILPFDGKSVPGNRILYLKTLDDSKKMKRLFRDEGARLQEAPVKCRWIVERQKWAPIVEDFCRKE